MMGYDFKSCTLCPRRCGADRTAGVGYCGVGDKLRAARASLHMWEEPCISGSRGSGAVFFSGCPLGCIYCQNRGISHGGEGCEITVGRLAEIFGELEASGAHNLNMVSPTQFTPQIIEALTIAMPRIPVVWNTGGYERLETLELLRGRVDIYLCDFKYASPELAGEYSGAPDYPEVVEAALLEMYRQVGPPELDSDGMLRRGLVVRHLVLPGCRRDSIAVLRRLGELLPRDGFLLSLMNQYTPFGDTLPKNLTRRLTSFEYDSAAALAAELGFRGFLQDSSSQTTDYTPAFDGTGLS